MKEGWTIEDDFRFTIEMALSKARQPVKRSKNETRAALESRRNILAKQIAAHIRQSNWIIKKGTMSGDHANGGTSNKN